MEDCEVEARTSERMDRDDKVDIAIRNGDESEAEQETWIIRSVSDWSTLPEPIMDSIFHFLNIRQRYTCTQVCRAWYYAFFSPHIWRSIIIDETAFTHIKHSPFGDEILLNHTQVKNYLDKFGEYCRLIVFHPNFNFYVLFEFIDILTSFLRFYGSDPMPQLNSFEFTFACESRIPIVGPVVLGTGGKFFEKLIELFGTMRRLKKLKLKNLLVEPRDGPRLLEKVVTNSYATLWQLEILNFTKEKCPLFNVGMLKRLQRLVISPHQVNDDLMLMIADSTDIQDVVFVQDKYSAQCEAISPDTWRTIRQISPSLRVHLRVTNMSKAELLLQERAPVHSIIHNTSFSTISTALMHRIVEHYRTTLRAFGHLMLPRRHGSRSFHNRADAGLVALVRRCSHLETLFIRDRVSTATVLVIAEEGRWLQELVVRRNGVMLRADWPKPYHWSEWQHRVMLRAARSYDAVEDALSLKFGRKWKMLSDAEYMRLRLDLCS